MSMRVSKIIRTRIRRVCWGCGKQFERGTLLRSQIDASKGQIGNSYWCKVCDKTIESEHKDSFDRNIMFASVCNYESWKDNLKKYSRTYTAKDKLIKPSTEKEQEVVATKEDNKSIESSKESEQEVVATKEDNKSIESSKEGEQGVVTAKEDNEVIKSSKESEHEVVATKEDVKLVTFPKDNEGISSNGDYIEEFLKYFRAFNVDSLLNDLKGIKQDYENNHKFLDIADDLEEFEAIMGQLLTNIENYVFEPVLREDEDNRSLFLIYLTNEKRSLSENRLIGVADNIERLQYTVNELLNQYVIGKSSETYNRLRFNDLNYLNTIPYLFIDRTTLNLFETDAILSEAE
ncbi:hypothetical protein ABD91_21290 [Lysinibacillus sphaericus]|uniref:hypothetical protein n=1 Tax=Lysinibacillus sphaericus TaxID=1421 RepID=UPI0018CDBBC6|nr:hypothetical protein [Lysinibacillus sphaericus]MBG9693274.1 hypothetical protein [Lysinibacillus sphaericus]